MAKAKNSIHHLWQKRRFREHLLVALLFLAGVHWLYAKTVEAGFVTDFTGMQVRLDGATFWDFLHCFGFPALHQVTNFFLYIFHTTFGNREFPWYLVFTSLHTANAFLGFLLARKILEKPFMHPAEQDAVQSREKSFSNETSSLLAACMAGLLFLFSPYNVETVVWKVCFNFLCCTFLMLSSMLCFIEYITRQRRRHLFYAHGLYALALFTFELALVLPLLIIALAIWWERNPFRIPRFTSGVLIPYGLLTVLYFLLNKIVFGGWVGHYGEDVHLQFDPTTIAASFLKYFSKYLLFWREWAHPFKEGWMATCEDPAVAYGAFFDVAILIGLIFILHKRMDVRLKAAGFGWLLFFIALLPVCNLYVAWLLNGENDRYGYLASLFFFIGWVSLIWYFPTFIRNVIFVIFLSLSIYHTNQLAGYWKQSATVVNGLLEDFRWEHASEVYVLAFPENYRGIPMFKDFSKQDLALRDALYYGVGKKVKGAMYQVGQFNMTAPDNGFSARVDSTGLIRLTFDQWGSWWWRHGIGTGAYETPKYQFEPVEKGCEILIREKSENAALIFSNGGRWEEMEGLGD